MNKIPSILVNTGFPIDQNGVLTEIVTPSVVATLDPPKKIVFNGTTLNYLPSNATTLEEFLAPNCTAIPVNAFKQFTKLTRVDLSSISNFSCTATSNNTAGVFYGCTALVAITLTNLTSMNSHVSGGASCSGTFYGCTGLTNIDAPLLASITDTGATTGNGGSFYGCTGLININFPALANIENTYMGSTFRNCTGLTTVTLPRLISTTASSNLGGVFYGCIALQTVQLGSEGNPVASLGGYTFNQCTQSGLTITIYTNGGAALSGSPWGATNATIVYEEA